MQVETSAPISMQTGDRYLKQPVKITLPWAEVADASDAQIISEMTDAFWNEVDSENIADTIACLPTRSREQLMQQIQDMLNIQNQIGAINSQTANLDERVTTLEDTTIEGTYIGPDTPTDDSNLWVDTDAVPSS